MPSSLPCRDLQGMGKWAEEEEKTQETASVAVSWRSGGSFRVREFMSGEEGRQGACAFQRLAHAACPATRCLCLISVSLCVCGVAFGTRDDVYTLHTE